MLPPPAFGFELKDIPHDFAAATKIQDIGAGKATPVLSTTLLVPAKESDTLRSIGDVSLSNNSAHNLSVAIQLTLNGRSAGPVSKVTLAGRASMIVPFADWSNGVKSGDQSLRLTVLSTGAVVSDGATLFVVAMPISNDYDALPSASTSISKPLALGTTRFSSVARVKLGTTTTSDIAVDGWVGIDNPTKTAATVALRYTLNGIAAGASSWTTVPAGTAVDAPISTLCNTSKPAVETLGLQMLSSSRGLSVTGGVLGGVGLPATTITNGASPIPSASSYGTPMTLDANTYESVVDTTNDSSGAGALAKTDDSEMSSWVTLQNPNATAAKVSVRQTTDGKVESDDPVFLVTVGAHTQLTVPTGILLCNEMPLGVDTFGVQLKSSLAGLQVQVATLRVTAWASPETP